MNPDWSQVRKLCEKKIEQAETQLRSCPLEEVEKVRGRIEAYEVILRLGKRDEDE